jgi:phosphatidylinositol alpha-mannosyltransferase
MRIALVTEYYHPHVGGVTEHVENLATELSRTGHDAVVITSNMPGQNEDDPRVRRVGRSRVVYANGSFSRITTGLGIGRQLEQLLRDESPDLVHVHGGLTPVLGLMAPRAARRVGVPVVATYHSWVPRSLGYRLFRGPLQRHLDGIAANIAVSQPVIDALSRYFRADWRIIPNGVDVRRFNPNGRKLTEESSESGGHRLLFVGRLDPRNGLDTVLAALPRILARHPDARLEVVGDGPLRRYYQRLAEDVRESVHFTGTVADGRVHYYSGADLYLCPSRRASFGITLLEAMACATPLVVSDITGFRELVACGQEAVLVPPDDPAAWAAAVLELLGDSHRRKIMGMAGLKKASHYSWPRVAHQVLEVYREVLR